MPEKRTAPPCPPEWPCGGSQAAGGRHREVSASTYYRHRNKAMDAEVERINKGLLKEDAEVERHFPIPKSPERESSILQKTVRKEDTDENDNFREFKIKRENGKFKRPLGRTKVLKM